MQTPSGDAVEALEPFRAEIEGRSVPRHYGDVPAEYGAVRGAVGIAERTDRAQLRIWGRDPVRMVQGLITNDLAGASAGKGVYAAMLTPKGRMLAELRAFRRETPAGAEVLLDLPREALQGTREHLKKFVPPMFARWTDLSDEHGCIGVYGPHARELVVRSLGFPIPDLEEDAIIEAAFGSEPLLVVGTREAGLEEGFDLFAAATALPAMWRELLAHGGDLGVRPVGFEALEILRIEAGRPRYGHELTEEIIPTEAFEAAGLLPRAISLTKGCYTGQEVIIRIAHRGHVNRHLRGLLLGAAPPPAPRTRLLHPESGREVGWTASAAVSPLLGQTIALGYVRREIGAGGAVRLGSPDGALLRVVALPFSAATEQE